jgi:hypothetical protein
VWDPKRGSHVLPDSLYLTAKPPFMGDNPWPWVDPVAGIVQTLPARVRFEKQHGLP